jgi:hypothetical protein
MFAVYQRNLRTESDISKRIRKDLELPLFEVSIIETATDNFSNKNKLGEGGFGPVYKVHIEVLTDHFTLTMLT